MVYTIQDLGGRETTFNFQGPHVKSSYDSAWSILGNLPIPGLIIVSRNIGCSDGPARVWAHLSGRGLGHHGRSPLREPHSQRTAVLMLPDKEGRDARKSNQQMSTTKVFD